MLKFPQQSSKAKCRWLDILCYKFDEVRVKTCVQKKKLTLKFAENDAYCFRRFEDVSSQTLLPHVVALFSAHHVIIKYILKVTSRTSRSAGGLESSRYIGFAHHHAIRCSMRTPFVDI